MRSAKTVFFSRDRDFSRLIEIFVIISDFCGFLDFFLDLDQEILDFYKYLDRDRDLSRFTKNLDRDYYF